MYKLPKIGRCESSLHNDNSSRVSTFAIVVYENNLDSINLKDKKVNDPKLICETGLTTIINNLIQHFKNNTDMHFNFKETLQTAGSLALILVLMALNNWGLNAQTNPSNSLGNTFIHSEGNMTIFGEHTFDNSAASGQAAGSQPGLIGGERVPTKGYFNFAPGSKWVEAQDFKYVDGYVRFFGNTKFLFPIGDNYAFRPCGISGGSYAEACYYGVDPTSAVTSDIRGGDFPVLPGTGPFASALSDDKVINVSEYEYWDINGIDPTIITLTWNADSKVDLITNNDLERLTIVGWNGTQWEAIPSAIDLQMVSVDNNLLNFTGAIPDFTKGSISAKISVAPSDYEVYTFGSSCINIPLEAERAVIACKGEELTLSASSWEEATLTWSTGQTGNDVVIQPDTDGIYSVTAKVEGCEISKDIAVEISEVFVDLGQDTFLCRGTPLTLTAEGTPGGFYQWDTGNNMVFGDSVTVNLNAPRDIQVTISNDYDCMATDIINVTIRESPDVETGRDAATCLGDSVAIEAFGSLSGFGYNWSTGDTLQKFFVSPAVTTTYSVSLTENGCTDVSFTTVEVHPTAFVEIMNDSIFCGSDEITIETEGSGGVYKWSTGETTENITVLPENDKTYAVTVISNGNCYWVDEIKFKSYDDAFQAPDDINICGGQELNLAAEGLFETLTWSTGSSESSINVTPSQTTTYDVTASYKDCEVTQSVTVNVQGDLDLDLGDDFSVCKGETVTLSTNVAGQFYWSTGENTPTIEVTPYIATTYTVRVTSGDCVATDEITINIEDNPAHVEILNDPLFCPGGTLRLETEGTEGTYLWSNGQIGKSITVIPVDGNSYSVTITNANGCTDTDQITMQSVNGTFLDIGEDIEICSGQEITLMANGEFDSVLWSNGSSNTEISVTPLSTTTYDVEVTLEDCTATDQITVTVVSDINLDLGEDIFICRGESVDISDAAIAGDFMWSSGENSESISVSPYNTTTYIATVTSGACEDTDEITVFVEDVNIEIVADTIYCESDKVTMTASGTDGDLVWSTGVTDNSITITPDPQATYSLTVTTENGCSAIDEISFSPFDDNYLTLGEDKEICLGQEVTIEAEGIYDNIVWDDGSTNSSRTVSPNATQTYSATATYNGCESQAEVTIKVVSQLDLQLGSDVTICAGEDIALSGNIIGNYSWSNGQNSESIIVSPNETTTYIATVSSGECQAQDEIRVIVEATPEVSISGNNVICSGDEVTITAVGTQGNYLWSTGQSGATINLTPFNGETYTVTVTTLLGCTAESEITFESFEDNYIDLGEDLNLCSGASATLEIEGVFDNATWSTGGTGSTLVVTPTETKIYSVTVTYGECQTTDQITVKVVEQLDFNLGPDISVCAGQEVELSGNVAGNYKWSTGESASSILVSPLETSNYTVTVSSGNCEAVDNITVEIENMGNVEILSDSLFCLGDQVTLQASGSAGAYKWNNGEVGSSIMIIPTHNQSYSVTVTSVTGCTSSDEITMISLEDSNLDLGDDMQICAGENVTIELDGNFDTINWSNGQSSSSISVTPQTTTTYSVTASLNGCLTEAEMTINVVEELDFDLGSNINICAEETVNLSGNVGGSYSWSTGENTSGISVTPTETTTYSATVSSGNCTAESEITINVDEVFAKINGENIICEGEQAVLTVDGPPGASYAWSNGESGKNLTFNPIANIEYRVTVTSLGGCKATDAIKFELYDDAAINIGQDLTICAGETVNLDVTGIFDRIEWDHGVNGKNINVSPSVTTTYICTAIYGNCFTSDEITINVVDDLNIDLGEDIIICPGQTVSLSDLTVNGSFLWSTGENSAVIEVSPTSTSTYKVTVSSGNCVAEDEVSVIVQSDCEVDLYVNKTVSNFSPNVGDIITFTVLAGNSSNTVAATNVEISENIRSGFRYISYTSTKGIYDVNTGKWYLNSIEPASQETLTIEVEVLPTGDYSNSARVVAVDQDDTDSDPDPDNDDEDEDDQVTITLDVKDAGDNGLDNSSEIGDYIWLDTNGDGFQNNDEFGIPGVTINLYQSNNINTVFMTLQSDQDGYFCFTGLSSGNYFVEFIIPDGYVVTKAKEGVSSNAEDKDSDIENTFGYGTTNIISLGKNQQVKSCDGGIYPGGSIGDIVWFDAAGGLDARYEEGTDSGVEGVRLLLIDAVEDTVIATTLTDQNGFYTFENLPRGQYILEVMPNGNNVLVTPNVADDDIDSDFNTSNMRTPIIILAASQHIENIDAGLTPGVVPVIINEFWGERIFDEQFNKLFWSTESEINSDFFIIERSLNNTQQFEPIGEVSAAGNSQETLYYTFDDLDSRIAGQYYYRLIMVDLDGREAFSKIIVIEVGQDSEVETSYKVFPIPTSDYIKLEMTLSDFAEFKGYLVNNLGQNIRKIDKRNLDAGVNLITLDVRDLSEGTYYLNFYIGEKQHISRILVIKN